MTGESETVLLSHQPELHASYLYSVPNLSLLSAVEACLGHYCFVLVTEKYSPNLSI